MAKKSIAESFLEVYILEGEGFYDENAVSLHHHIGGYAHCIFRS